VGASVKADFTSPLVIQKTIAQLSLNAPSKSISSLNIKVSPNIRSFLHIGFYILSLHEEDLKAGRIRFSLVAEECGERNS